MKKKSIAFLTAFLSFMILFTSVAYAWFRYGDDIHDLSFKLLRINSTVTLYRGIDDNYNGVPEYYYAEPSGLGYKVDEENQDLGRTWAQETGGKRYLEKCSYYDDFYNFLYLGRDYARSEYTDDTVALQIGITDALPSRVYTYKFALENKSDADNKISFNFAGGTLTADESALKLLSTLAVRFGTISHDNGVYINDFSQWMYLGNSLNGNNFAELFLISDIPVEGMLSAASNDGSNCADFWVQIEMVPYGVLCENIEGFSTTMTQEQYNALAGKSTDLPMLHINFNIESASQKT